MSGKAEQLTEMLAPSITGLGYELWGVEFIGQGRKATLRIYIDAEQGITVDDCSKVSHQVSGVLDVEDPIPGEYTLEVSSPGMDRPLFNVEQYKLYTGAKLSVRLRMAFEGRRKFVGRLHGVEGDEIVLAVDEHEYLLPLDSIDKAQVVPEFEKNDGKKRD